MKRRQRGFTLVEIVVVLAIAGLIMGLIFKSIGGAKQGNRDAERKAYLSKVASLIETFAANNNGVYPATTPTDQFTGYNAGYVSCPAAAVTFYCPYIVTPNLLKADPLGGGNYRFLGQTNAYAITQAAHQPTSALPAHIIYAQSAICNPTISYGNVFSVASSTRQWAVAITLEQSPFFCIDNS